MSGSKRRKPKGQRRQIQVPPEVSRARLARFSDNLASHAGRPVAGWGFKGAGHRLDPGSLAGQARAAAERDDILDD